MSFTSLLIQTCDIQGKTLNQTGYEKTKTWSNISTDVPCRKDSDNGAKINDDLVRINTDDDLFFFGPDVTIDVGNRIVLDAENYDVIKVNESLDSKGVHHIEVKGRLTDHD